MAESKRLAAHRAGVPAVNAAETNPEVLLAGMNDEQIKALTEHLTPKADMKPKKESSEDGDDDDENGDSEPAMDSKKKASEPDNSATAMGNDRLPYIANALANDPDCKGKDALAMAMLADADYANVNASGLVKLLGKTPATSSASASAGVDTEAAARAEMKAAIEEGSNSEIDADAGGKPSTAANATAVWERVIARMPGNSAK
jgi:hypothetical protein